MRALLAAGALIVLAAQPALAAWSTSAPGAASAKAGVLTAVTGISCTSNGTLSWTAVPRATGYDVSYSNNGNSWTNPVRVPNSPYATGQNNVYVKMRAAAGSKWLGPETVTAQKIC